jgi:hypothetical protein
MDADAPDRYFARHKSGVCRDFKADHFDVHGKSHQHDPPATADDATTNPIAVDDAVRLANHCGHEPPARDQ